MKKLFVCVLAIASMVACMNDEIVSVQKGNPIAFDSYVENATRVGYNSSNPLDGFDVWAFMDNTDGVILADEDVTGGPGNYTYTNTQYWIPGHTYYFAALAPMESANVTETLATRDDALKGLGTVTFTNVDGTEDLLYAATSVVANDNQGSVNLQFKHLLSKVKFSFTNTFVNANYSFVVRNIAMTVPAKGTIDLTAGEYAWDILAGETTLAYGDTGTAAKDATVSPADERLTIPASTNQKYILTFDVDLYVGANKAMTYNKKSEITGIALEAGKAYNFAANINAATLALDEIVFDAEVDEWGTGTGAPQFTPYTVEVAGVNYDDFAEAVAVAMDCGEPVKFFQHVAIDADTTITVPADKTLSLELNGYTLTGVTDQTGSNRDMFTVYGTMNVNGGTPITTRASAAKNGTISVKHIGDDMEWGNCTDIFRVSGKGKLNLNEVTAKNLGGTAMAYVVDMSNANDLSVNINNSTLESTYIPVRLFNNAGKHTVTISNTSLTGKKCCVWVQYGVADGRDQATLDETVILNVYNPTQNNTFTYTGAGPVLYGFNEDVFFDASGNKIIADGVGYDETTKTYTVSKAIGLDWVAENVAKYNGFEGYTIELTEDIDCFKGYMEDGDPVSTSPIGKRDYTTRPNGDHIAFKGTFDGQGHSIKRLYQNGWALGYEKGQYGSIGLFSRVENATIKNLVIDGCEMFVEGGNVAAIAGNAIGDCTFENITIKNTTVCSYENGVAGIVAWSETGNYTFKNIVLEDTFTVASFWGAHGTYLGGVVAEAYADCSYKFENIEINCRLDAYNDVVSNYQWYIYRCDGMLVGNVETRQTIGDRVYPDPAGCNITCTNVTVNYGDWINYHYCESPEFGKPSYADEGEWKFKRVEPGYSYGGIDYTNCNHGENETHYEYIPFDQLFGGGQNGTGRDPVCGLKEYEGVTVTYPESFYLEQGYKAEGDTYTVYTGAGFKTIATTVLADASKNVTIELANDIDLAGIEWPAVKTAAAFVLDGKGKAIKNLTTSAVEDHGFWSTAMFTSTRKDATIKNLVVENATVTGKGGDNSHGAVLVACNYAALNIEGVTVKNSTVSNCDRSSVLVTYLYFTAATVKDCVVEGCTVDSIGTAGALLGYNNSNNFEATGNTVKGTTISSSEGSNKAGILIGTWKDAGTLTESENTVENSKAINAGTETNNNIGRHA